MEPPSDLFLRRVARTRAMSPEERIRAACRMTERYRRFVTRIDPDGWEKVCARHREAKRAFWKQLQVMRDSQDQASPS